MLKIRHSSGLLLVAVLAVVGYGLVTLPPQLIEGYHRAIDRSPLVANLYLAVVTLGGLILLGLLVWLSWRIWTNTRRKEHAQQRRGQDPSQMSSTQRTQEIAENLSAGKEYAATAGVATQLRAEIEQTIQELEAKRETQRFEIVAFGTISSGKSSLLNALAGAEVFRTNIVGGTTMTRSEIPWPAGDCVILSDTPGLAEVRGEARAAEAAHAAKNADLVLFVVDGPLKGYERDLLSALGKMEKRMLICLNKEDWYDAQQQKNLLAQIAEQVAPAIARADVVAVRSRPVTRERIRILADGGEEVETTTDPPDIQPLAQRMLAIVRRDGSQLLLANLLMQSRGLIDEAKERVLATLDEQAEVVIRKYMWAAGGVAAVNPIPLLDLAGGSAVTVKMVLDLAGVYKQAVDADTIVTLLSQLGKNLIAMLGATAAAPALAAAIGALLKTVPGVGTIAGGLIQGMVQAVVTRWIGRVFMAYFRAEMQPPEGGLAELAREKWAEVTRPAELRQLIRWGREKKAK